MKKIGIALRFDTKPIRLPDFSMTSSNDILIKTFYLICLNICVWWNLLMKIFCEKSFPHLYTNIVVIWIPSSLYMPHSSYCWLRGNTNQRNDKIHSLSLTVFLGISLSLALWTYKNHSPFTSSLPFSNAPFIYPASKTSKFP